MCAHFSIFLFVLISVGRKLAWKKKSFFFNGPTYLPLKRPYGWASQLLPWLLPVTTQAGEAGRPRNVGSHNNERPMISAVPPCNTRWLGDTTTCGGNHTILFTSLFSRT